MKPINNTSKNGDSLVSCLEHQKKKVEEMWSNNDLMISRMSGRNPPLI